ncbi:phage shock protein C (PspC) family protein [Roseateles sp. YR242]|uniref:PspC domain-containing protein n=1 Tax=Roseateles sp. YR242 TaxID=1855305 RepID=UPI0008D1F7EA|nr:PspC domain-containing protein [Roseateles sp. YR242]SEK68315.1 phage shock protein C (PspC) family protein [Roseateles sp. YR242]
MSASEELQKLADLHQRGILSDEEFAQAKARVLGGDYAHSAGANASSSASSNAGAYASTAPRAPAVDAINALRRSRYDRWLGGVCGGIARLSGLPSWFWRIVFVLLVACAGSGFLLYLLLWIFVPQED